MRRQSSLQPHMVYFSATQKRVFLAASKYSLTNLNAYIRDLLTRDVELRAEQGEPYFEGLRDELRKAQGQTSESKEQSEVSQESLDRAFDDGRQAGLAGESRLSSQFIPGSNFDREWSRGWNEGWNERLANGREQVEPLTETANV